MTRIAISAGEYNGLDSVVSPHFGRCPYFVLVDLEEEEVKTTRAVPNPYYSQHQPGQVPGFIHSRQVNVMLTGGMGGRAISFFEQYGIQAATGASGTVRHALEQIGVRFTFGIPGVLTATPVAARATPSAAGPLSSASTGS